MNATPKLDKPLEGGSSPRPCSSSVMAARHGANTWVTAAKWLPMGPHVVLVTDMECIWVGCYDGDLWRDINDEPFDSVITHWMELPELPGDDE